MIITKPKIFISILAMVSAGLVLFGCALQQASGNPFAQKDSDWPAIPAGQPVTERIRAADGKLLDYLRAMDNNQAYTAHDPTPADRELIAAWIAKLPATQREVLDTRVAAIALVDHFMGNGMADFLRPADTNAYPQRYLLFINADILSQTISQRMTMRDNSAFRDGGTPAGLPTGTTPGKEPNKGPGLRVSATLADGSEPPAIWFLLMHETAHLWDFVHHATPKVDPMLPSDGTATGKAGDRPLTAGIWKDYGTPLPDSDYPLRASLAFFGLRGASISLPQAPELYRQLLASPFPSLYGSTCWAEYWAEMATWLQFSRAGGRLTIELVDADGKTVDSWKPLENSRVLAGFEMIGREGLAGL
jgi:hypothetical protein